jgi:hypothetical protein
VILSDLTPVASSNDKSSPHPALTSTPRKAILGTGITGESPVGSCASCSSACIDARETPRAGST